MRIFLLFVTAAITANAGPNVLFIVADDLGWNDVGYHGSEISTPNIDMLATKGVQLDRFYAFPVCSPTRTALMTARSPLTLGIHGPLNPTVKGGVPTSERLLPEMFRDAGYQTFITGKWHLGHSHVKYFPTSRGFDHFYGHLGGTLNYYLHTHRRVLDWQRNGKSLEEEGYSTHLVVNEAVQLIKGRDKSKPFLMYVPFNAPHSPLQAPDEAIDKYAHIEDEHRRIFAAMVDELDIAIGRLLDTVKSEGQWEDTLIVFMSDNGGENRVGGSNLPLAGNKTEAREGGIRVPAAVYWPGKVTGPRVLRQMVSVQDWMPTLAAAIGTTTGATQKLDGQNMWPAIAEDKPIPRHPTVIGGGTGAMWMAAFSGSWKLLRNPRAPGVPSVDKLFRITTDPLETTDLAKAQPSVAKRLAAVLDNFPIGEQLGGGGGRQPRARKKGGGGPGAMPDNTPPQGTPYAEAAERD